MSFERSDLVFEPVFSPRRIAALLLRHLYLLRSSWPRLVEMAYWPTVQLFLWGFMTKYLASHSGFFVQTFGMLLSAVMLWDVLFRGQLGVAISFLEEMWSRNLGHLFVSPLRPVEFIATLLTMSVIRTLLGALPVSVLAIWFFDYSIYGLGLPLVGFFCNLLIMGWATGLAVSGLVLRHGQGAESLAWVSIFAISPITGIWYPIAVLPDWLQPVAWALPSAHVFEGMRAIMIHGAYRADLMLSASLINLIYIAVGALIFLNYFRLARRDGQLLQMGE